MASLVFTPGGDSNAEPHVVTPGQQRTKTPLLSPTTRGRRGGCTPPPETLPRRGSHITGLQLVVLPPGCDSGPLPRAGQLWTGYGRKSPHWGPKTGPCWRLGQGNVGVTGWEAGARGRRAQGTSCGPRSTEGWCGAWLRARSLLPHGSPRPPTLTHMHAVGHAVQSAGPLTPSTALGPDSHLETRRPQAAAQGRAPPRPVIPTKAQERFLEHEQSGQTASSNARGHMARQHRAEKPGWGQPGHPGLSPSSELY